MRFLILTLFILLASCSSMETSAGNWGKWKDIDITKHEREWDICESEKYGQDLHLKGFCWSYTQCRKKKLIFGRKKKQCRVKIVHCKWGDIECMIKYNLNNATLIIKK